MQQHNKWFRYNGSLWEYNAYIPSGQVPSTGFPVIILLHGGSQSPDRAVSETLFNQYVDPDDFALLVPNTKGTEWNDGRAETASMPGTVAFIEAVLADAVSTWQLDVDRVFVTGPSSGGMMTQRVAADDPSKFKAFASVIANYPADRPLPTHAAPILLCMSKDDPLMPYYGGEIGKSGRLGVGGTVISADATTDAWLVANSWNQQQPIDTQLPILVNDGTTIEELDYTPSPISCPVIRYIETGAGHTWPGGAPGNGVGVVSGNLGATETIIAFFQRYGL